jgi:hypothetical protein
LPRGVTLSVLIAQLRAELQQSTAPSLGQSYRDTLKRRLQTTQEWLWLEYTWPFLTARSSISLQAGSRYYNFPTNAPLEQVREVLVKYDAKWLPVERGITMDDYSVYDSDDDVRLDPALKWDVLNTGSVEQMEFWPLPATNGTNNVRVISQKPLKAFTSDSDVCTLDSNLLLWFSAADLLAKSDPKVSNQFLGKATRLLNILRGRVSNNKPINFAKGRMAPHRQRTPLVARASS